MRARLPSIRGDVQRLDDSLSREPGIRRDGDKPTLVQPGVFVQRRPHTGLGVKTRHLPPLSLNRFILAPVSRT